MTAPSMASITALEKSLQNCSLGGGGVGGGIERSRGGVSYVQENLTHNDTTLELKSNMALTGEVYYINWEDERKVKEDPRMKVGRFDEQNYYSDGEEEEEEEEEEEDDNNSYDSEGSSSSSVLSPSPSRDGEVESDFNEDGEHILVVACCKSCMMYFMLPKRVEECPECNVLLLHFDRLENESLWQEFDGAYGSGFCSVSSHENTSHGNQST